MIDTAPKKSSKLSIKKTEILPDNYYQNLFQKQNINENVGCMKNITNHFAVHEVSLNYFKEQKSSFFPAENSITSSFNNVNSLPLLNKNESMINFGLAQYYEEFGAEIEGEDL